MASSRTRQGNKWLEAQVVEHNKEPEQKLWISVLAKAFDDAFEAGLNARRTKIRNVSKSFLKGSFFSTSAAYLLSCYLSDFSP